MPAPPGATEILEIGRALVLGGTTLMTLFVFTAVGAYLFLCAGSERQWDGSENRWRTPRR